MITSFSYHHQDLSITTDNGPLCLKDLLKEAQGPSYIYSAHSIKRRIALLKASFSARQPQIHFALKANAFEPLLQLIRSEGLCVDVVSKGEAEIALRCGFTPQQIIFSGVAKSKKEIEFAIHKGFFQINVESLEELKRVGQCATELKKETAVGLRINPNIRVDTHPYITTGFRENKFGISDYQILEAMQIIKYFSPWICWRGLSSHIGSQIRDAAPLVDSLEYLVNKTTTLSQQNVSLQTVDMGGGFGIDYHSEDESKEILMIEDLGKKISSILPNNSLQLLIEPGRWIVARSGVLCAQVEYVKFNGYKNFVVLNTGMHHLLRPALYKAHHRILPLKKSSQPEKIYDIVGPICESSDVLGQDRSLATPQEGDWLAIMDTGAYGRSMSSSYNHHPLPQEILV